MAMTLHVFVEGLAPFDVEDQWMVRARDTEALSGSIPVKVDAEKHDRVATDDHPSTRPPDGGRA